MNLSSIEARDRSRQMKRSEHRSPTRSPRSSKSPRGGNGARGSTADQRLDQSSRELRRENVQGDEGRGMGNLMLGSPPTNPVGPSRAATMASLLQES